MGASQRRKGHQWERDVAKKLREAMPGADIRRGLQAHGDNVPDVDCPVFWPECKVGKQPNPRAALAQAVDAAPKVRIPIAVIKDDRKTPFVVLQLDDMLDFIKEWWERR